FLGQGSLTRLGMLFPPTCVGLRYGRPSGTRRGFSRKSGRTQLPGRGPTSSPLGSHGRAFVPVGSDSPCLRASTGTSSRRLSLSSFVPAALTVRGGAGLLTCLPSPTPRGLGLGPD